MEAHMLNCGAVVLKCWLHIDKDEQERRFNERMNDPAKQWKITDEDWRNREKWDAYEAAVNEMLVRTSTTLSLIHISIWPGACHMIRKSWLRPSRSDS